MSEKKSILDITDTYIKVFDCKASKLQEKIDKWQAKHEEYKIVSNTVALNENNYCVCLVTYKIPLK